MTDTMLLLQMLAFLLITGAVAGMIAGLLGVGGGIVLVPAFFYVFGALGFEGPQLMQMCLATSLATIIVTSVRSVLSQNKKGAVDWDILRSWAPGIVIGAALGVMVAGNLRSGALQMIFGVLTLILGLYMALGRSYWQVGDDMPTGAPRMLASPVLGFMSVLLGIGGGSFGVPFMSLHGVAIHRAVATAAGFGVLIAVPAVIGFLFVQIDSASRPPLTLGAVNLVAFIVVIAMTLMAAPLGVRLAHEMDAGPLKKVFGVFLTLVALNMLRKAFGF